MAHPKEADTAAFDRHDLMNRRLRPTAEQLVGSAQINLATSLGPLDPLCELEPGQGYEQLLPHTEVMREPKPQGVSAKQ